MKKFIFGIIAIVMAVAVWMSLGKKDGASDDEPVQRAIEHKIDTASLRKIANMVWRLVMENAVDVRDSSALNQWQEQCGKAMIAYYDSLHPNEDLKDYKKMEAVIDDMEKLIPEGITTIDMINNGLMDYCMQMFRKTAYSAQVQQTDSNFVRELQAWSVLEGHLIKFCMGAAESTWAGGSACSLMMGAARNAVLRARVRDLIRILQLEGGSDAASEAMVNSKKEEVKKAIAKAPIKAPDGLFDAMDQWMASRERYNGCTAVAFDDMAEAVWYSFSSEGKQEDEEELEEEEEEGSKSLNDIRFENFKDKDWIDNEYIRELRRHIDRFLQGKVKDEDLEVYRDEIKGKFIIWNVQPFLGGGLFIQIVFVDHPQDVYSAWVYSDVDSEKEKVTGYGFRYLRKEEEKSGYNSKSEILKEMGKSPEYKLW